jgi:hypothetical protein
MIPMDRIDVTGTWGPDMDATNEPWSWEIASYLRAHGYQVSSTSWEGQLKTKPEKIFERINGFPVVRDFGPLCFIHAVKK